MDSFKRPSYLLVGSGRLAVHMRRYFKAMNLDFTTWSRKDSVSLAERASRATHVWILVSDGQIQNFIQENLKILTGKTLLHASGALTIREAESVHPLASFSAEPFDLDFYQRVSFITEKGRTPFRELFPELKNQTAETSPEQRALYHSLCVVAGNFTTLLWNEVAARFEDKLSLDSAILKPYLESIERNLMADLKSGLTGPLARGDSKTIQMNLEALKSDGLYEVYKAFLKLRGLS